MKTTAIKMNRWRLEIVRQIIKKGKQLPFVMTHMDDETALEFLKAYYPHEFKQIMGKIYI